MNDHYLHEKLAGLRRNMRFNMAKFLHQDKKYKGALRLLNDVIEIDRRSGEFNDLSGDSPLIKIKERWMRVAKRTKS